MRIDSRELVSLAVIAASALSGAIRSSAVSMGCVWGENCCG